MGLENDFDAFCLPSSAVMTQEYASAHCHIIVLCRRTLAGLYTRHASANWSNYWFREAIVPKARSLWRQKDMYQCIILSRKKNSSEMRSVLFRKGIQSNEGRKIWVLKIPLYLAKSKEQFVLLLALSNSEKIWWDLCHFQKYTFSFCRIKKVELHSNKSSACEIRSCT